MVGVEVEVVVGVEVEVGVVVEVVVGVVVGVVGVVRVRVEVEVEVGVKVVVVTRKKGVPNMKRIVETQEGGFEAVLGEKVCLFCGVYIYTGVLQGVNADHLELKDPKLVYATGELASGDWADAQRLPGVWRVMKQAIESWGPAKV